jgi:hypothetical protein
MPDCRWVGSRHDRPELLCDQTVQTRVGHRRATTTLDIYAKPTAAADRGAAEALGAHFLGSSRVEDAFQGSLRDGCLRRTRTGTPERPKKPPLTGDLVGGASKNRTYDLSIISPVGSPPG